MTPPQLARRAIEHFLRTGRLLDEPADLPDLRDPAAAFVTLHRPDGSLRGCIGTTAPTTPSLAAEIIANAADAATADPRFEPVSLAQLPQLHLSVDVLSPPVPEPDPSHLDPKRFGIIVSAAHGRRGVLLPDLEDVNTVAEQIAIAKDKAGIGADESVKIAKFEVKRYEE